MRDKKLNDKENKIPDISGAGGGGKKGGAGSSDNTLQSVATARIVEALSEGPIVGLVHTDDGSKSIYFDETPLTSLDGTVNFENVKWTQRKGLPDDDHLQGHSGVETLNPVDVEVTTTNGPVTRTLTNPSADAVRVMVRIDSLFQLDDEGQAQTASLNYTVEIRPFGGSWSTVVNNNLVDEKASSPVQIAHRFELPVGGNPWDIRVTKVTPDSTEDSVQTNMTFEHYTTLIEGRFTYPHTALIGLEVEAESMGQSIPERAYLVKGRIIDVPDNYNPDTRVYTGMWTGLFNQAWTNNPAWIFYDLLTNDRYGLGEFISASEVSNLKWQLYTIGQYCDQEVPSGFKTDASVDIMEPRFQFNGVLRNRQDAYHALQSITTSFRGMGYWALGQIFATADMPADPVKLATPANVINGEFSYSSTAMKARHNVAMIRWNDPNDFYRSATELVVDNDSLNNNAWREKSVDFLGCTSRGLAHRYGKWILDVENSETETVEYKAGFDHLDVAPGNIIAVQDPRKANIRLSGRIVSHASYDATRDVIILDAETALSDQVTNKIYLLQPDGVLVEKVITDVLPDQKTIYIEKFDDSATQAQVDSVFTITAPDVNPRQYRVISVNETEESVFQVTALFHDPNKYARVEQGISLEPISYTKENTASTPTSLTATEIAYVQDGLPKSKTRLSWVAPVGMIVREYVVQMKTPTESKKFVTSTKETSVDIEGLERGSYIFYVTAISRTGKVALPAELSYTVTSTDPIATGVVSDLGLADTAGTEFQGRDVRIVWNNLFPSKTGDSPDTSLTAMYDFNTIRVFDNSTNTLLREVQVRGSAYTYSFDFNLRDCAAVTSLSVDATRNLRFEVQVTSKRNNESLAAVLVVTNPVPDAISPNVIVDGKNLIIRIPSTIDTDLRGVKIWVEGNSTFNHTVTTPVYNGPPTSVTFVGDYEENYFVKAGYYDHFDDTVIVTPAVSVTTPGSDIQSVQTEVDEVNDYLEDLVGSYIGDLQDLADNDDINTVAIATVSSKLERRFSENGFMYDMGDPDDWVHGWSHNDSDRVLLPNFIDKYSEATAQTHAGEGPIFQVDGAYRVMSERNLRSIIKNEKFQITVRERLASQPTSFSSKIWMVASDHNGTYVGYAELDQNTSLAAGDGWVNRSVDVTPSAYATLGAAGAVSWGLMFGFMGNGGNAAGGVQQVSSIKIENITTSASIRESTYTIADANVAIAGGITTYNASVAGGLSSTVVLSADTLAEVTGFLTASANLTAELSNGQISGIRATVYDDGDQLSGSLLELIGDNVIASGTVGVAKLVVSDFSGNVWPNGTWIGGDFRGYNTPDTEFTVVSKETSSSSTALNTAPTPHVLQMESSASLKRVSVKERIDVKGGDVYTISGWIARDDFSGTDPLIGLVFSCLDSSGAYAGGTFTSFTATSENWNVFEKEFTVPANATHAFLSIRKAGDASAGIAYATRIEAFKKRSGSTVILPQSITTPLIAANAITAASGIIDDLAVDTLQINGDAVSIPLSTYISNSIVIPDNLQWYDVVGITFNKEAYPVKVQFSSQIAGTTQANIKFRVIRNGSELRQFHKGLGAAQDSISYALKDLSLITGNMNYKVQATSSNSNAVTVLQSYLELDLRKR